MSRILRDTDNNGRDKVESKKDLAKRGIPSPNIFDGGVMVYAPIHKPPSAMSLMF